MVDLESLKEILIKLQKQAQPQSRATEYALRRQFGDMVFDPKNETMEFIGRFDDVVKRLRKCSNANLNDDEVKRELMMAIEKSCPNIYTKNLATEKGLTIDEIKTMMIDEEIRKKELQRREETKLDTAMAVTRTKSKTPRKK